MEDNKSNSKKPSSKVSKWIVFTSMPMQMAATIYLCYLLGDWLDEKFAVEGLWWTKGLSLLGVGASLYQVIRQANRISKDEK